MSQESKVIHTYTYKKEKRGKREKCKGGVKSIERIRRKGSK